MNTETGGFDFRGRVDRARELMHKQHFDALYVNAGPNMTYFSGFSAYPGGWPLWLSVILIPQEGDPTYVLSEMHHDILQAQGGSWIHDIRTYVDGEDPTGMLKDVFDAQGIASGRIGVEDSMWFGDYELISRLAPRAQVQSAQSLLNRLRMVKDMGEIEAIRQANRISDAGFEAAVSAIREGRPEYEAAVEINNAMLSAGSEAMGAGGQFRMLSNRTFEPGDIVDVDLAGTYQGYHSDTARNVFVGQPTAEEERMYNTTVECFHRTMEAIRPGVEAQEVHHIAEEFMVQHGYRQVWKIGHGVGLNQGHEAPYLQTGETLRLEPGMVFTIDPGTFVAGKGKDTPIHIEDDVLVTESGCENLTNFRREMIVV